MKYFIFLALFAATYAAPVQDDKIIGGYECRKNSVSYLAYVNYGFGFCAGALISRTWVVAPALCGWNRMKVHLGEHNLGVDEGTEQIIDIEKTIDHPHVHWDYLYNNDIMLVKLSKPATLNNYVRTVSLPTSCAVAGTKCLISGWPEWSVPEGSYPDRLMCLDVPILSDTSCNSAFPGLISSNMFCAESIKEGIGSCLGDFGGPLVCNGQLQGLMSWGQDCTWENTPAVYTKVCKYNSWIREIMMSE
uniref:trypsin n=1 Tax=Amphiprion percula TaxID=161767 RepID=A0A3P8TK32_AMPPE